MFGRFQSVSSLRSQVSSISIKFKPLGANPTKWLNTLKKFVGKSQRIAWVFDHLVGLALKELKIHRSMSETLISATIRIKWPIPIPTKYSNA